MAPLERRIMILRHAKAEAADGRLQDHDRTLTARGLADARRLGALLVAEAALPDLVLCSTAARTRETFAALGWHVPVKYLERLYLASAGDLIATLQMLDDSVRHVLVIGHNPGLLEAVVWLMADALHEKDIRQLTRKFPTATLADLTLSLGQWRDLAPASATLARVLIGREVPELREPIVDSINFVTPSPACSVACAPAQASLSRTAGEG